MGKLNVDDRQRVAQACGVMSIPTLVACRDGMPLFRVQGLTPKHAVVRALKSV